MKCINCDSNVKESAIYCPNCGFRVDEKAKKVKTAVVTNKEEEEETKQSSSSIGWGFLGFFIPLVGLILFLVWRSERPSDSKAAGIGALIRVCLSIVFMILSFIFLIFGLSFYSFFTY